MGELLRHRTLGQPVAYVLDDDRPGVSVVSFPPASCSLPIARAGLRLYADAGEPGRLTLTGREILSVSPGINKVRCAEEYVVQHRVVMLGGVEHRVYRVSRTESSHDNRPAS